METFFSLDLPLHTVLVRFSVLKPPLRKRPVAENVVHKREIHLASVARIDDRADQLLDRHRARTLSILFSRYALGLSRFAKLDINGAQDTVHESTGRSAPERLCKFDGLIYRDFRRHLRAVSV